MAKKARRASFQVFQPKGREGPGRPWYIRFRDANGRRVAQRAMFTEPGREPRPAETEDEAFAAGANAVASKALVATQIAKTGARDVTLATFAKTEHLPGFHPRSARHRTIVEAQLLRAAAYFKATPIHSIGTSEAKSYFAALGAAGVGLNTQRRHKAALSKCWQTAIERKAATVNPWRAVPLDKAEKPSIRFRPEAEVAQIVAHCPAQIRPLLAFVAATGCRYAEAAGLRWSEVAQDLTMATIPGERTKTGELRKIRLGSEARRIIEERREARVIPLSGGEDFVFALRPATKKKPARVYSHGYCFRILTAAMEKAGIPSARPFHTLRNSLASRMVMRGVPLSVVAEAIGDSFATTAKHYGHLVPDDAVARAYQALEQPQDPTATAPRGRRRRAPARIA